MNTKKILEIALQKEHEKEIEEWRKKNVSIISKKIFDEGVKSLEKAEFDSYKCSVTGDHIITIKLNNEYIYDKAVEEELKEKFLNEGFKSASYLKNLVLVLHE